MEDQGGWTNRSTVEAFETYAKTLFNAYGDRVTHWLTINEPNIMLLVDRKILGKTIPLPEKYQQFHHLMIAEKLAFKHCHELVPNGKIGPVLISRLFMQQPASRKTIRRPFISIAFGIGRI